MFPNHFCFKIFCKRFRGRAIMDWKMSTPNNDKRMIKDCRYNACTPCEIYFRRNLKSLSNSQTFGVSSRSFVWFLRCSWVENLAVTCIKQKPLLNAWCGEDTICKQVIIRASRWYLSCVCCTAVCWLAHSPKLEMGNVGNSLCFHRFISSIQSDLIRFDSAQFN